MFFDRPDAADDLGFTLLPPFFRFASQVLAVIP